MLFANNRILCMCLRGPAEQKATSGASEMLVAKA